MDGYYRALSDFSSIHWWISVVIVGILINLSSSGIQSFIGRFWGRLKLNNLAKTQREKKYFERHVRVYTANPVLMAMDAPVIVGLWLFAFTCLVASFAWFFGNAAFFLSGPIVMGNSGLVRTVHLIAWFGFTVILAAMSLACANASSKMQKPLVAARRQIESGLLKGNTPAAPHLAVTSKA